MSLSQNYCDYIVYVDESGDHGMGRVDPTYPVLSLDVFAMAPTISTDDFLLSL